MLQKCRPISLLSQLYMLLLRITTNKIKKLDDYQLVEQAVSCKGFGTSNNLLTVRILIENVVENSLPLFMA